MNFDNLDVTSAKSVYLQTYHYLRWQRALKTGKAPSGTSRAWKLAYIRKRLTQMARFNPVACAKALSTYLNRPVITKG